MDIKERLVCQMRGVEGCREAGRKIQPPVSPSQRREGTNRKKLQPKFDRDITLNIAVSPKIAEARFAAEGVEPVFRRRRAYGKSSLGKIEKRLKRVPVRPVGSSQPIRQVSCQEVLR